jgi:hypothetical protein
MVRRISPEVPVTRRAVGGASLGSLVGLGRKRTYVHAVAAPGASPAAGWTYTDAVGTTVSLPTRPVRIAANLVTAAALWDLGVEAVAVFDWTASAHPDGDYIA